MRLGIQRTKAQEPIHYGNIGSGPIQGTELGGQAPKGLDMLGQLQGRFGYRTTVTVHSQLKIRIRMLHRHQKLVDRYRHTQFLFDFAA